MRDIDVAAAIDADVDDCIHTVVVAGTIDTAIVVAVFVVVFAVGVAAASGVVCFAHGTVSVVVQVLVDFVLADGVVVVVVVAAGGATVVRAYGARSLLRTIQHLCRHGENGSLCGGGVWRFSQHRQARLGAFRLRL